jgi:hypothetical protein
MAIALHYANRRRKPGGVEGGIPIRASALRALLRIAALDAPSRSAPRTPRLSPPTQLDVTICDLKFRSVAPFGSYTPPPKLDCSRPHGQTLSETNPGSRNVG